MVLPPRLEAAARFVPPGARVADVGCDHGFLSCALLMSGIASKVYAIDLRPLPLSKAGGLLARENLLSRAEVLLGDGLSGISPGDVDCVAICGMGGDSVADILRAAPWTAYGRRSLILQPASSAHRLRRFLYEGGYTVTRETLTEDGGRVYATMLAMGGETGPFTPGETYYSRALRASGEPLRTAYLRRELRLLNKALQGVKSSKTGHGAERLPEIEAAVCELSPLLQKLEEEYGKSNRRL